MIKFTFALSFLVVWNFAFSQADTNYESTQPASLDSLIGNALKNNVSIKIKFIDQSISAQRYKEVRSGLLPSVAFQLQQSYSSQLPTSLLPAKVIGAPTTSAEEYLPVQLNAPYQTNGLIELTQLIWSGAMNNVLRITKAEMAMEKNKTDKEKEEIAKAISHLYFNGYIIQKQLSLIEENLESMNGLYKSIEQNYNAGLTKQSEVQKVEVNRSNLLSSRKFFQSILDQHKESLRFLAGLDRVSTIRFPEVIEMSANDTIENSSRKVQSPDMKVFKNLQDINLYEHRALGAAYLPNVIGYAQLGNLFYGAELSQLNRYNYSFNSIGLKLYWDLFDGFKRESKIRTNIYNRSKIEFQKRLAEQDEDSRLKIIEYRLRSNCFTLEAQRKNVALASKVYQESYLSFKSGLVSITEVLQADLALKQTQDQMLQAESGYLAALIDFKAINHTLIQFNKN